MFNQIQRNLQISTDLETISDSTRILQISTDLKTVRTKYQEKPNTHGINHTQHLTTTTPSHYLHPQPPRQHLQPPPPPLHQISPPQYQDQLKYATSKKMKTQS
jgi:hypothetical protein